MKSSSFRASGFKASATETSSYTALVVVAAEFALDLTTVSAQEIVESALDRRVSPPSEGDDECDDRGGAF